MSTQIPGANRVVRQKVGTALRGGSGSTMYAANAMAIIDRCDTLNARTRRFGLELCAPGSLGWRLSQNTAATGSFNGPRHLRGRRNFRRPFGHVETLRVDPINEICGAWPEPSRRGGALRRIRELLRQSRLRCPAVGEQVWGMRPGNALALTVACRGLVVSFECWIGKQPGRRMEIPNTFTGRKTNRRQFVVSLGASLAAAGTLRMNGAETPEPPVTFGLIADLHHGLCPTAMDRLAVFMEEVALRSPAFILQLGDFCFGDTTSRECLRLWSQFSGPRYHVLGNHDMDRVSKRAVMDAWEMPDNHYSFDRGGFHIVVLDCNFLKLDRGFVDYDRGNYFQHPGARAHVDAAQLEWLKADLNKTRLPTIVFSHQGLSPSGGAANRDAVRQVMTAATRADGMRKVVACFCGHHHVDRLTPDDGIPQVWINSASYHWVGEQYGRMADYRDSLFTFVTLDPSGTIRVTGRESAFVAPSPRARGYPNWEKVQPRITERMVRFQPMGSRGVN